MGIFFKKNTLWPREEKTKTISATSKWKCCQAGTLSIIDQSEVWRMTRNGLKQRWWRAKWSHIWGQTIMLNDLKEMYLESWQSVTQPCLFSLQVVRVDVDSPCSLASCSDTSGAASSSWSLRGVAAARWNHPGACSKWQTHEDFETFSWKHSQTDTFQLGFS